MIKFMIRHRIQKFTFNFKTILYSNTKYALSTVKPDLSIINIDTHKSQLNVAGKNNNNTQVDVAVIGGGSGGIAFSFQAKKLGLDVILFDYVNQTHHGTKWGLGGTCVNVGCIPKKLMHQSALLGQSIINANDYGWDLEINTLENKDKLLAKFSWQSLLKRVNSYIRSLNFGYKSTLAKNQIRYQNALATILDPHTVLYTRNKKIIENFIKTGELPSEGYDIIKAKNIVIATGSRPTYFSQQQCKGSKLAITSDDIFWMKKNPGKTLIVGGGYVAVEIAGFMAEFGINVSMMTRGLYLRSFDQDMVKLIIDDLHHHKVNIIPTSIPIELGKVDKKILVKYKNSKQPHNIKQEIFDTVLFAIGRTANTEYLNLDKIGIEINKNNKKIKTDKIQIQRTHVQNIYAIGDVVDGVPELTGTVQKAAAFLAKRIASNMGIKKISQSEYKNYFIDFKDYPTTIFTPIQYSLCGLNQEEAKKKLGQIQVYHSKLIPLQESLLNKYDQEGNDFKMRAYMKVITDKNGVVYGIHYIGPNAGEIMQGYAVAIRMGLTKQILDRTIGIHPTVSEQFTNLKITKSSGQDPQKTGC